MLSNEYSEIPDNKFYFENNNKFEDNNFKDKSEFWEDCLKKNLIGQNFYNQVASFVPSYELANFNEEIEFLAVFKDLANNVETSRSLSSLFNNLKSQNVDLFYNDLVINFKDLKIVRELKGPYGILPLDIEGILKINKPHILLAKRSYKLFYEWLINSIYSEDEKLFKMVKNKLLSGRVIPDLKIIQIDLDLFLKKQNLREYYDKVCNSISNRFSQSEVELVYVTCPRDIGARYLIDKLIYEYPNFIHYKTLLEGRSSINKDSFIIFSKSFLQEPQIMKYRVKSKARLSSEFEIVTFKIKRSDSSMVRLSYIDFKTDEYSTMAISKNIEEVTFWLQDYWSEEEFPHILQGSFNRIEDQRSYHNFLNDKGLADIHAQRYQHCDDILEAENSIKLFGGIGGFLKVDSYRNLSNENNEYFFTNAELSHRISYESTRDNLLPSDTLIERYAKVNSFIFT